MICLTSSCLTPRCQRRRQDDLHGRHRGPQEPGPHHGRHPSQWPPSGTLFLMHSPFAAAEVFATHGGLRSIVTVSYSTAFRRYPQCDSLAGLCERVKNRMRHRVRYTIAWTVTLNFFLLESFLKQMHNLCFCEQTKKQQKTSYPNVHSIPTHRRSCARSRVSAATWSSSTSTARRRRSWRPSGSARACGSPTRSTTPR